MFWLDATTTQHKDVVSLPKDHVFFCILTTPEQRIEILSPTLLRIGTHLRPPPPYTTPPMHRHLTHLLINRHPLMPASSFTPLSPASHLKSHLSLIMDSENASLLTNNISRSALIMHTKPSDTILPSGHTLSHPDNKTPSNRLSYTHIDISGSPSPPQLL